MLGVCDKCGEKVHYKEDALYLADILNPERLYLLFAGSRHLFATENCVGSPSRAQYLENQPKDERLQYAYQPHLEKRIREAYTTLQTLEI